MRMRNRIADLIAELTGCRLRSSSGSRSRLRVVPHYETVRITKSEQGALRGFTSVGRTTSLADGSDMVVSGRIRSCASFDAALERFEITCRARDVHVDRPDGRHVRHGALIHHSYPTLSDYIEHMNRYSSLGAEMVVAKGKVRFSFDQHRPAAAVHIHLQLLLPPWISRRPRRTAAAPLPCGLCVVEIREGVGTVPAKNTMSS